MLEQILASQSLVLETQIETLSFNTCYRVRTLDSGQILFLKILAPARHFFERGQEVQIQILASQAGLSPLLLRYHHDHDSSWLLLEYVESTLMPEISDILVCLKSLHQCAVPAGLKVTDPLVLASHYLDQAFLLAPDALPLKRLQEFLLQLALPECANFCLCHLDVHPHNFLTGMRRTYMIDFENAGVFDPLYDVAVLGFYLGHDAPSLQQLVDLYGVAEPIPAYRACFAYQSICLCLFLCFLAYRLLARGGTLPTTEAYNTSFSFSDLIQEYWQAQPAPLQAQLERDLFCLGFARL